jgi:hypothetical protein
VTVIVIEFGHVRILPRSDHGRLWVNEFDTSRPNPATRSRVGPHLAAPFSTDHLICMCHRRHADQRWEFDGITIGESTAVYERIAVSTAGRANSNNSASPSTVTFAIFGALLDFASTAMEVGPAMWLTLVLDAILQLHQAINHGLGTRRASGDIDIDGDDSIDTLEHGVIVVRST